MAVLFINVVVKCFFLLPTTQRTCFFWDCNYIFWYFLPLAILTLFLFAILISEELKLNINKYGLRLILEYVSTWY